MGQSFPRLSPSGEAMRTLPLGFLCDLRTMDGFGVIPAIEELAKEVVEGEDPSSLFRFHLSLQLMVDFPSTDVF